MVELELLGDVEARVDGHLVDIGHARQRCVLVALLIQPNRVVPAELLIERAWADQHPLRARNALSAYVSRLRRVFAGTDEVRFERRSGGYVVSIDPTAVDLRRFHDLLGRARASDRDAEASVLFAQALKLWRGEAFASLDTPWINAIRGTVEAERLAAELEHNEVRLRLGRHHELLSDLATSAAAHSLDERLAGQFMLALYRCGRQAEALTHYEQIRKRLAAELGVDPTTPLQELYQRILVADPALPASPEALDDTTRASPAVLLERSALLAQLDATVPAGAGGRLVLVAGESGVGKSALVGRFIHRREGEIRFLVGLCDPLLTPRPLGPLRDIAGQIGGPLARQLHENTARDKVFAAFLDELAHHLGPQVVVVEDAHWADEATVDLLVLIGRRLPRLKVTLIVTFRDNELGIDHPLRTVLNGVPADRVVHVRPEPLSESAVAELARRAGRAATGLHAITGGNPLLVTEVLAASEPGVPATVRDLALARFAGLTVQAQEVVRFVAVIPTRAELWVLKEALGADPGVVEDCVAGGLLVLTDDTVGFRHELIRQAIEESLLSPRRQDLNQRALDVLAGAPGVDLARLVHHARQACDVAALLRFGPLAAEEAEAAGSHREAVDHYRAALQHAGRLPDVRWAELLEGLSLNAYLVGLAEEALTARLAALEVWETTGRSAKIGESLRWVSRLHWWAGRRDEAEASAAQAIAVLEAEGASRELAMAYSNQGQLHLLTYELAGTIEWSTRAIAVAEEVGDQETIAHALTNIGTARMVGGDLAGRADTERAIEIAIHERLPDHAARAMTNTAIVTLGRRDYQQASDDLDRALEFTVDHDLATYARYVAGHRACLRMSQGDWPGAEHDAQDALGKQEKPGLSAVPALVALGLLRARRGDADAADTLDEAAHRAFGTGELLRIAPVAAARAEHAWLCGDPEQAATEAAPAFELALRVQHPWFAGELAWWLHRTGRRPDVRPWFAEPYRLLLSGDWAGAAEVWERLRCPYEQAEALSAGDTDAVRQAVEILDGLGADPAARLLRRRLG